MCLFLMVEDRMVIYTLIRNSVVSFAMRDGEYAAVHTVETKGARHDLDSWGQWSPRQRCCSAPARRRQTSTRDDQNSIQPYSFEAARGRGGEWRPPQSSIAYKCLPGSRAGASSGPCPRRKGRQQSPYG